MFQELKKVAFHTLGCKLNFSETATIARQFHENGFLKVDFQESADIYVINTCSVTENADKECKKIVRQALKKNPDAFVIVTGCFAQLQPEQVSHIPGVDVVLGAKEKFKVFELIDSFEKRDNGHALAGHVDDLQEFNPSFSLDERTRAFLKIQDGCDYSCTFCTIPQARGESRSGQTSEIIKQAQFLASQGIKEIVLTGVNIGDFGKNDKHAFLNLLQALDKVDGIERFRISSIEPNLLKNQIIEFVAQSKKFMPHFHIPLQSGDNEILGLMRRRYKRELYAERVETIKSLLPDACIGVDVIVGFPGETDLHFEQTKQFLHELEVSYFHVFTYSERPNTPAIEMPNVVPIHIRQLRNKILRELSDKKKNYFYNQFADTERLVLVEGKAEDEYLTGFTDNYIKVKIQAKGLENSIIPVLLTNNVGQLMETEIKYEVIQKK